MNDNLTVNHRSYSPGGRMKAGLASIRTMIHTGILPALLILSAVNLALMIPGGFVENRHFPGYSVTVLSTFNIFLTLLGLGSFLLAYRVMRFRNSGMTSVLVGVAYVLVYALDLLQVFPVSSAPMSRTLVIMEWTGTLLGLITIIVSLQAKSRHTDSSLFLSKIPLWLLIIIAIIALAIVTFATLSAR